MSLIISICHAEISKSQTTATHWVYEHEQVAIDRYAGMSSKTHDNFRVEE